MGSLERGSVTKEKRDEPLKSVGADLEFLRIAKEIVLYHQEKWDGTGYPEELSGDDIPISARLMAVADVYDALTNRRPYKEAFSHERAVAIIMEGKGSHFDPDLVDAFSVINEEFRSIARKFSDHDQKPLVYADLMLPWDDVDTPEEERKH